MRFCFAYDLVAVLADLRAGAVALINEFSVILRVRAKPALARKTASAANGFGHTVFRDLLRIMVHAGPAAAAVIRHAVADRVAETSVAVSDVPAVSQCVPERQHISWLQIQCVHADARIRAVDLIFPAGALCEVLFAKPGTRAFQVQTVAVDAAPENVQIGTFAELRVDHVEVFFLCPAPLSAQRVRAPTKAASVVQTGKIEANAERIIALRGPAEAPLCRAEGFARVIAPDRLCDSAGRGFARQNVAGHRTRAEPHDAHVNDNGRFAELLSVARVFSKECDGLFALVAEGVFGGDDERIFDRIALVRRFEFRHLILLPVSAGHARKAARFAVQLDAQRRTKSRACDVSSVVLCILAPGANLEVQRLPAGDALDALKVTLDLHLLVAPVLIRDADGEGIFFARAACFDGEGIFARLAVFRQKERHAACRRGKRFRAEIARLIAGDRRNFDARRVFAGQAKLVGKKSACQLIVIDIFRADALLVFTRQLAGLRGAVFCDGIRHFQRHVALIADGDGEGHGFSIDLCRHEHRIARTAFTCLQLDGAICGRDIRSIAARARDLRIIRTSSLEIELIQKLAAVQLIVLDAQSGSLVRIAQKLLRGDGFFIPCELQLQV